MKSEREFEHLVDDINAGRPQCPVGLMTLVLPRKGTLGGNDKQPFVYIKCGHVHGQHQWGQGGDNEGRTCPLCLTVSDFASLNKSHYNMRHVMRKPDFCLCENKGADQHS